jgi:hypothetical protein
MTENRMNHGHAAYTETAEVLIVEEQVKHNQRSRLTDSLSSVLHQAVVSTVARAADAPAVLGRDAQDSERKHWFVICGLTPPSWSTLVLLEWMRRREATALIYPALLTETAHELLPIAVVDHPRVRVMSASPSLNELQTWFGSVWPSAMTRRPGVGSESPPRMVSR